MVSPTHHNGPVQECKMCGGRMSLCSAEQAEPGFEIQTFECDSCHSVGQLMAAVDLGAAGQAA